MDIGELSNIPTLLNFINLISTMENITDLIKTSPRIEVVRRNFVELYVIKGSSSSNRKLRGFSNIRFSRSFNFRIINK